TRRPPGRTGDVPTRRGGPAAAGALRAFRRPRPGRRAGAAEVGAQDRREIERTRPARALASFVLEEWWWTQPRVDLSAEPAWTGDLAWNAALPNAATPSGRWPGAGSSAPSTAASPSAVFSSDAPTGPTLRPPRRTSH